MRVLVTGGTGFLGSHIVEGLLEEPGTEVFALVRDPGRPRWLGGERRVRLLPGISGTSPPCPTAFPPSITRRNDQNAQIERVLYRKTGTGRQISSGRSRASPAGPASST